MLQAHLSAVEKKLLAEYAISGNSGHPLHKGTPREAFVRAFLSDHLGTHVGIGTGEVIDSDSRPAERRNQFDTILYDASYPKLQFGGGISAFLVESVVATLEIKSLLTKEDLGRAIRAARRAKALRRRLSPDPGIRSYLIAYDGPQRMDTVYRWLPELHAADNIAIPAPLTRQERETIPCPSMDGVFVLGKGYLMYDNSPAVRISDETLSTAPQGATGT